MKRFAGAALICALGMAAAGDDSPASQPSQANPLRLTAREAAIYRIARMDAEIERLRRELAQVEQARGALIESIAASAGGE